MLDAYDHLSEGGITSKAINYCSIRVSYLFYSFGFSLIETSLLTLAHPIFPSYFKNIMMVFTK